MKDINDRIGDVEDRLIALEKYVEQNKQNITGLYVGSNDRDRRWRRKVLIRWGCLIAFNVVVLTILYFRS